MNGPAVTGLVVEAVMLASANAAWLRRPPLIFEAWETEGENGPRRQPIQFLDWRYVPPWRMLVGMKPQEDTMIVLTQPKGKVWMSFDLDQFVADCRNALAADKSHGLVREVVKRAVTDPAAILKAMGEPTRAVLQTLYRSDELTVLNVVWAPNMTLLPHDHRMWAVIGIYSGREDNIFWRRPQGRSGKLEAVGAKALSERDAEWLGYNIIHSVINPIPRLTAALHVYGGDFFAVERSEWDPETLSERRFDPEQAVRRFEEANRRLAEANA